MCSEDVRMARGPDDDEGPTFRTVPLDSNGEGSIKGEARAVGEG